MNCKLAIHKHSAFMRFLLRKLKSKSGKDFRTEVGSSEESKREPSPLLGISPVTGKDITEEMATADEFEMALDHCMRIIKEHQQRTLSLQRELDVEREKNSQLSKLVGDFEKFMKAKFPLEYLDVQNKRTHYGAAPPAESQVARQKEVQEIAEVSPRSGNRRCPEVIDSETTQEVTNSDLDYCDRSTNEDLKEMWKLDIDGNDVDVQSCPSKHSESSSRLLGKSYMAAYDSSVFLGLDDEDDDLGELSSSTPCEKETTADLAEMDIEVSSVISSLGSQSVGHQKTELLKKLRKNWLRLVARGHSLEVPKLVTVMREKRVTL